MRCYLYVTPGRGDFKGRHRANMTWTNSWSVYLALDGLALAPPRK